MSFGWEFSVFLIRRDRNWDESAASVQVYQEEEEEKKNTVVAWEKRISLYGQPQHEKKTMEWTRTKKKKKKEKLSAL